MKLSLKSKYFIAGFLIPTVVVPLIDYGMNIIGALQEIAVLKISKTGVRLQKECQEIAGDEEEEVHTCAIGFQPPDDYNYEEDDDDED